MIVAYTYDCCIARRLEIPQKVVDISVLRSAPARLGKFERSSTKMKHDLRGLP